MKSADKFDRWFWTIWTIGLILSAVFWGGVVFVAVHFLSKVW